MESIDSMDISKITYGIILYENSRYIFYKDNVFSKMKQEFIKRRYCKKHKCHRVGITYMKHKYKWILLTKDYHLSLDDIFIQPHQRLHSHA